MELENIYEVMEELLEHEISKLFKSIEGVTDVLVYDITIKGRVNGYLSNILICWEPYMHVCITIIHVCIS